MGGSRAKSGRGAQLRESCERERRKERDDMGGLVGDARAERSIAVAY